MKKRSLAETINLEPDKKLRIVWLIIWSSLTLLCYVVPIVLIFIFSARAPKPEKLYLAAIIFSCVAVPVIIFSLIWLFLYFRSLNYEITDMHIRVTSGVWWRRVREIPMIMIADVMSVQGPLERLFDLGHLCLQTAGRGDESQAEGILRGLPDFITKRQEIIGRIGRLKSVREILADKEERRNSIENLLTGILNELRELRFHFSNKK